MYVIHIKNCAFFARHGVHDEEEFLGQRFYVDAMLNVNPGDALETANSIDGTVNYGKAFQVIEKIQEAPFPDRGARAAGCPCAARKISAGNARANHGCTNRMRPFQAFWIT